MRSSVLLALLFCMLPSENAYGQDERTRRGFWVESAGGVGTIRVSCTDCENVTRRRGTGGFLRLGGTLSREVLMGVESSTISVGQLDDVELSQNWNANAVILWFPWHNGFFMKGGTGLTRSRVKLRTKGELVTITGTGVGLTFGLGYDIPISKNFAITGNMGAWISATGDIELPTGVIDDPITSSYLILIGLTYR